MLNNHQQKRGRQKQIYATQIQLELFDFNITDRFDPFFLTTR